MKVVMVSEDVLDTLIQGTLDAMFRSPDPSKMAEKIDHRTANYHLQQLKLWIKESRP